MSSSKTTKAMKCRGDNQPCYASQDGTQLWAHRRSHGLWKSLIYSRINTSLGLLLLFLLNYNLMLDRSEFIDEADRLYFGPLSGLFVCFFNSFIY